MAKTSNSSVIEGISSSLTSDETRITLEGYKLSFVTACENEACENEFEAPVIISADELSRTQVNVVCNECENSIS